ncbi:MAG: aminopeptidase P family protein [Paracoccaceae bacterium]
MFQSFDTTTLPENGPARLEALRAEIRREGIDGFLIPRADAHQGENVAPHDERLAWLTGFTGSAGFCVALLDRAGVFIDGRYRVQVKSQVALSHFTPVHWPETKLAEWLKGALPDGGKVGFDPWLHTVGEIETARQALDRSGIALIPTHNLVDRVWTNQPPPPQSRITPYPIEFAGESNSDKRAHLADDLTKAGHRAAVLTLPDSIAWLLNVRGADVANSPVAHAFAILTDRGHVALFTSPGKADHLADHLGPDVTLADAEAFTAALGTLPGPVRVDKASAPLAVSSILTEAGAQIAYAEDPCRLPKARKNAIEIAGAAEAHLRDGAAMVEFLAWLDATAPGGLTEIDLVTKLESFRRATNALVDISFETIAGSGPNGAVIHYRVTRDTDRALAEGDLVVIDSGGQYLDGTTDITRTVVIGDPQGDQRACFTRVLQGMIAISRARWPKGVAGCHLDALARAPLWMAGQDYDHGTGHGVGAYLSVHEGPQALSRRSDVPLEQGMILSNEPGYYREGAFGIRIENLIVVQQAPALPGGDAREMLEFQTLTFVPIDRRLIDPAMMSKDETDWLNAYHARVLEKIGPRVSAPALGWLQKATAAL